MRAYIVDNEDSLQWRCNPKQRDLCYYVVCFICNADTQTFYPHWL